MKKIIIVLVLLSNFVGYSQIEVDIKSPYTVEILPSGSYVKDIDGDFDKFVGTWVWTNGTDTVIFKLIKVVHQFEPRTSSYEDYMIGDYSYTTNNGSVEVVNTIDQSTNLSASFHPLYACNTKSQTKIHFIFSDVVVGKSFCYADFEFLPGSTTQLKLKQSNSESLGCIDCVSPPSISFTIPNNIVLTKQ